MKRFLYKPILHAIDAREKRIAAELADADAKKAEARDERAEFQRKNEAFDQQRSALLSKATDEAATERQRLLADARKAADAMSAQRQATLIRDARNMQDAISSRTQAEVFAMARKTLADLAGTSLEERMVLVLMQRLRELDEPAKELLGAALKQSADPVLVHSAFDLPADQRTAIQQTLHDLSASDLHVRFETAPDLISGIELTSHGQKVAWSISDYLTSLEKDVSELLGAKGQPA